MFCKPRNLIAINSHLDYIFLYQSYLEGLELIRYIRQKHQNISLILHVEQKQKLKRFLEVTQRQYVGRWKHDKWMHLVTNSDSTANL